MVLLNFQIITKMFCVSLASGPFFHPICFHDAFKLVFTVIYFKGSVILWHQETGNLVFVN